MNLIIKGIQKQAENGARNNQLAPIPPGLAPKEVLNKLNENKGIPSMGWQRSNFMPEDGRPNRLDEEMIRKLLNRY